MPISRKLTLQRLTTIYKRQDNPSWGSDYVPSILATRGEAPSISNAYAVKSARFGRLIHLLSYSELSAFVLAAYHPWLFGFQGQRMLSPEPRCHPLCNMPGEVPARFKPLKGVIDVADRMGYLSRLPKIKVPLAGFPGIKTDVVFPYIGDFLLAINDSSSPTWCVNWSIKADEASFKRPIGNIVPQNQAPDELILMRHELERTYYADAGIHTHFVASSAFDTNVINNLRFLYRYQQEPFGMRHDERLEMESRFQSCLDSGLPISALLPKLIRPGFQTLHVVLTCFYQAIWQRRLRIDLFRPILIDRPLHPESRDVLDVYAKLFQAGAVCA
ncbi:hypothetical protein [Dechloromonas denitrificans]|uniref:hypothetical protein n=1 Tax=Dechloromonas denitrificans TaxID=281362 RepID=UPI001CFAC18C|nr:hypothetical protein [Dechloromonas denitrificans]UCV08538.1 hypothetical protein KI615_03120 [Dechloromonas denitrificans]